MRKYAVMSECRDVTFERRERARIASRKALAKFLLVYFTIAIPCGIFVMLPFIEAFVK